MNATNVMFVTIPVQLVMETATVLVLLVMPQDTSTKTLVLRNAQSDTMKSPNQKELVNLVTLPVKLVLENPPTNVLIVMTITTSITDNAYNLAQKDTMPTETSVALVNSHVTLAADPQPTVPPVKKVSSYTTTLVSTHVQMVSMPIFPPDNVNLVTTLVKPVMPVLDLPKENVLIVKTTTNVTMDNSVAHITTCVCMNKPFVTPIPELSSNLVPLIVKLAQMVPT